MEAQPTCGEGLAAHAVLPQKLGQLTDAVAEILELHRQALELADENSQREDSAYAELAQSHRRIAGDLLATAERMAGYRNLPMGSHNEAAFADPRHVVAFERLVQLESELVALLEARLSDERMMLREMRGEEVTDEDTAER